MTLFVNCLLEAYHESATPLKRSSLHFFHMGIYIVLVFYILPLTYTGMKRKVAVNRDQLTPFSALLDPPDRLTITAQILTRGVMFAACQTG